MYLEDTTERIRRLGSMPKALHDQFFNKQYARCLVGIEELASQGVLTAAVAVSHIYFHGGGGVKKDYELARHWLTIVDDGNIPYAAYRLGYIYYRGLGVPSDHSIAYRFFRRGGLRGHLKCLLMAGWMLKSGDGVTKKRRSGKALLLACMTNKDLSIPMRILAFAIWLGVL